MRKASKTLQHSTMLSQQGGGGGGVPGVGGREVLQISSDRDYDQMAAKLKTPKIHKPSNKIPEIKINPTKTPC